MLEKYDSGAELVEDVVENARNTHWLRYAFSYVVNRPVHQRVYPKLRPEVSVADEDWDNLLVLDACRADLFEEVATLSEFDRYRSVFSAGSMTAEWTRNNFASRELGDVVYVTGNPFTSKLAADAFHDLIEVWKDSFSEERGTIPPEPMVAAARDARETYPDKRVVVHFMQPHYPFIGDTDLRFEGLDVDSIMDVEKGRGSDPLDPWEALERGTIDREAVWEAYARNLELVLEHAIPLARGLGGRSVVTSDHGNMLGERAWPLPIRLYGHPEGLRCRPLAEVPWAVLEGERRTVRAGETSRANSADGDEDEDELEDRLQALGYR